MTIPINEQKDDITYETQSVIMEVFFKYFESQFGEGRVINKVADMVARSVINADNDPGEWAPSAHTVIYHVNGMPSIDHIELWGKVSNELPGMFYVEAINPEVSAVYQLQ